MLMSLFRFTMREFNKRKKKTALITFALAWGTLSLLLLMSFGRGLATQMRIGFKGLGTNLVMFQSGQTSRDYQGLPRGRRILFYPEDVELISSQIPEIVAISPESITRGSIRNGKRETNRWINGVYPDFAMMRSQIPTMGGRFINDADIRFGRRSAFIGWKVAEALFIGEDPIGKIIMINSVPFTVVGVMKRKLQTSNYHGMDFDHVYIPYTCYSRIDSQRHLDRIHIMPVSSSRSTFVQQRIRTILGKKYRFDPEDTYAVQVRDTIENAQTSEKIFFGVELFLLIMGVITLLVGALGVTNLMYAMIRERTREIGVKMAMGAKRIHIISQFMGETLFIFIKGTMWGFLIAYNIVGLVRMIPAGGDIFSLQNFLLRPVFALDIALMFVLIMCVLIFLAGIFPAVRASRLNPVESLRYE